MVLTKEVAFEQDHTGCYIEKRPGEEQNRQNSQQVLQ